MATTANYDEWRPDWDLWKIILLISFSLFCFFMFFVACTSARPVALPTDGIDYIETPNRTHIEQRYAAVHDTAFVHDSVFIRESADTVFVSRFRDRYVERTRIDTAFLLNLDTIEVIRRIYTDKPLTALQNAKMKIGGAVLLLLAAAAALGIIYIIKKFMLY